MPKSGKIRTLKPDEVKLWLRVAKNSTPVLGKPILGKPIAKKLTTHQDFARFLESHPKPVPHVNHVQDASGHKRVKRGKLQIDATIDLHGYTQDQAQGRLENFILTAFSQNARCVLVITGKGGPIKTEDIMQAPRGILRTRLRDWLQAPSLRNLVSGLSAANPKHGGSGAFYVLLKAKSI